MSPMAVTAAPVEDAIDEEKIVLVGVWLWIEPLPSSPSSPSSPSPPSPGTPPGGVIPGGGAPTMPRSCQLLFSTFYSSLLVDPRVLTPCDSSCANDQRKNDRDSITCCSCGNRDLTF